MTLRRTIFRHSPKCIIKLCLLDVTAAPEVEASEAEFHAWLQELSNLAQVQDLYCSPLYSAFLKRRLTLIIQLATGVCGQPCQDSPCLVEVGANWLLGARGSLLGTDTGS